VKTLACVGPACMCSVGGQGKVLSYLCFFGHAQATLTNSRVTPVPILKRPTAATTLPTFHMTAERADEPDPLSRRGSCLLILDCRVATCVCTGDQTQQQCVPGCQVQNTTDN
jgi:hypothetical protein